MREARRAFTLIELMVILTIGAIVLGVAAAWIHQSLWTASVMRDRSRHHQSLLRLSHSLRDSVHDAREVTISEGKTLIAEGYDDSKTRFIIKRDAIELSRQHGDQLIQDRFPISNGDFARWDESELPNWVTLVVHRPPPGMGSTTRSESTGGESTGGESLNVEFRPIDIHLRIAPARLGRLGVTVEGSK